MVLFASLVLNVPVEIFAFKPLFAVLPVLKVQFINVKSTFLKTPNL